MFILNVARKKYDPRKRSEKVLFSKIYFFSKFFQKFKIIFWNFFLMKNRFFYIKECYADHHKGYLCSDYNVREHSVRLTCSRTCVRTWVYKDRANKNFKSKNFKNKPKNVINLIKFEGVKFFKISLSKRSSILIGRKARGSIHQADCWLCLLKGISGGYRRTSTSMTAKMYMIMRIYYQQVWESAAYIIG